MFEVVAASLVWQALAAIIDRREITTVDTGRIIGILAIFTFIAIASQQLFFGLSTAVSHLVACDVLAAVRKHLGNAWISKPLTLQTQQHLTRAKTLIVDHCERLETFIARAIPETIAAITMWVALTFWLFSVNPWLALPATALLGAGLYCMFRAARTNTRRMHEWMNATTEMEQRFAEFVHTISQAHSPNQLETTRERSVEAVLRNAELQSAWGRAFATWGAPFSTFMVSGLTLVTPFGAWLYQTGRIDAADLMLFFILSPLYGLPLVKIFDRMAGFPMLAIGARRIAATLAQPTCEHTIEETEDTLDVNAGLDIVFENVSVPQTLLHGLDFTIPTGSTTAVVGLSPAEATAFMEVMLGWRTPASGRVTVGGRGVDTLPEAELHAVIATVFAQPMLYAGSIRENLTLARPDATEQECEDALAAVGMPALPDGLDTQLGQCGAGLPPTQQRQIAAARALLANRPIVLVEEPEWADTPALTELVGEATALVLTPRLATAKGADQILVLQEGTLVEHGTPAATEGTPA